MVALYRVDWHFTFLTRIVKRIREYKNYKLFKIVVKREVRIASMERIKKKRNILKDAFPGNILIMENLLVNKKRNILYDDTIYLRYIDVHDYMVC
jgi:hypothetical protein